MSILTSLAIMVCVCSGSTMSRMQKNLEIQIPKSAACPMGCPEGWVRFGYTDSCYKLPSQPAPLDTFENHQRQCAQMDPTANIAFINRLREQGFAMAVAAEYGSLWTGNAPSPFLWLGLRSNAKGWEALDGSNFAMNTLVIATNITADKKPDMCLGVNPRTLGEWKARPCSDKGIAICEMPLRRVCGKAGKILPIIPVDMFDSHNFGLLFPTDNVPLLGKIYDKATLDTAVTDVSMTSTDDIVKVPAPGCQFDCPAGWVSLTRSPTAPCYLLPNMSDPELSAVPMGEERCQKANKDAHVSMVNGLVELSMWMAIVKSYYSKWQQQRPVNFIQLGVLPNMIYFDRPRGSPGNLIATLGIPRNARGWLVADAKTGGDWQGVDAQQKGVVAICEMPKTLICGGAPRGSVLDLPLEELTADKLLALFPHSPRVPFLDEVLDGKTSFVFNPLEAQKNEKSKAKYGDNYALIDCINGLGEPRRLFIKQSPASIIGQWTQVKCENGPVDAFKVDLISYVSAWSRCYNNGFDAVQPFRPDGLGSNNPFLIGDTLAEYYRSAKTGGYMKLAAMSTSHCY